MMMGVIHVSGSCGIGRICLPPTVPLSKNQKSPPNYTMSAEKSCQKAIAGLSMDTKVSLKYFHVRKED